MNQKELNIFFLEYHGLSVSESTGNSVKNSKITKVKLLKLTFLNRVSRSDSGTVSPWYSKYKFSTLFCLMLLTNVWQHFLCNSSQVWNLWTLCKHWNLLRGYKFNFIIKKNNVTICSQICYTQIFEPEESFKIKSI